MMISELLALRDVSHDAFKGALIPFLPDLLTYRDDGRLIWRERNEVWFKSGHACAVWNAIYPGTFALDNIGNHGYRKGTICSVRFLAHRVVWAMHNGSWPDECDHENGIRSDNRIGNLFDKDKSGNQRNASLRSDNTSGQTGVYSRPSGRPWGANIFINGRLKHLGVFWTKSEAIAARKTAERENGYHPNHGKTL